MFPVVWYPTGNKSSCLFYLVLYISSGLDSWASILIRRTRVDMQIARADVVPKFLTMQNLG